MKQRWRNLMCFLGIVGKHDYDPPFYPDRRHQYIPHEEFDACKACGGGELHEVHRQPWDAKRMAELAEDAQQTAAASVNYPDVPLGDH